MKIVTENQTEMIIKNRNIFVFVIGIFFVLVGLIMIFKPDLFLNKPPIWSGALGIFIGLSIIYITKITTITINKRIRRLIFKRKSLMSEKTKEYDLNLIRQIELLQVYKSRGKGEGGYLFRLVFVLDNGDEIPINPNSSSFKRVIGGKKSPYSLSQGISLGKQVIPEKVLGTRIAEFLKIPFEERRPPTITETITTMESAIQDSIRKESEKQKNAIN